ncbi:MAG: 16S rRNA (guanine(527)-N(7))-methyltransferase RsmG [Novosphingobium sp.]
MIDGEDAARRWVEALPECDGRASQRLLLLIALLAEENSAQNLVSAASLRAVWQRHIADSAQLLLCAPPGSSPWLDLGTGAGFPGLVVSILRPEIDVVLVESRKLRAAWLHRVIEAIGLSQVRVLNARLEDLPSFPAAVISARAFAPLNRTLNLSARFSTSETLWLLPKGRSASHELAELCEWCHMFHVEPSRTDPQAGIIIGRLVGRKDSRA